MHVCPICTLLESYFYDLSQHFFLYWNSYSISSGLEGIFFSSAITMICSIPDIGSHGQQNVPGGQKHMQIQKGIIWKTRPNSTSVHDRVINPNVIPYMFEVIWQQLFSYIQLGFKLWTKTAASYYSRSNYDSCWFIVKNDLLELMLAWNPLWCFINKQKNLNTSLALTWIIWGCFQAKTSTFQDIFGLQITVILNLYFCSFNKPSLFNCMQFQTY